MFKDLKRSIPYVYAIKTKKQAEMMSEHHNEYIKKHCQKILNKEPIIRRVKEFHLGQLIKYKDSEFLIVEFLNRNTIEYIDDSVTKQIKISKLRKLIKENSNE